MSYCVNCGVELDKSATRCPLCNQTVYHPESPAIEDAVPPFPAKKEQVEKIIRKDLGILFSIVFLATGLTCGILNIVTFSNSLWSLSVIGACVILWVMLIPAVIYTRLPIYVYLVFDGTAIAFYLYMLSYMVESFQWFYQLGLPITALTTAVALLLTLCIKKLPRSFLTIGLYGMTAICILCVGIEILIDLYLKHSVSLSWAALVLTVGTVVDAAIITMLSLRRVRNAVRRRLHF